MRVTSTVGRPFYNQGLKKQEYKKGEKLDGFTLPFPVFDSPDGLFRRFGLWQSSKGICLQGLDHEPVSIGEHTMLTEKPVLVGDSVLGKSVLHSECQYRDRWGLWDCRVVYGHPPEPQKPEKQEIALLKTYVDSDEALAGKLVDLVASLFEQVLPLCVDSLGVPLVTTPASSLFITLKEKCSQEIQDIIQGEREKIWQ